LSTMPWKRSRSPISTLSGQQVDVVPPPRGRVSGGRGTGGRNWTFASEWAAAQAHDYEVVTKWGPLAKHERNFSCIEVGVLRTLRIGALKNLPSAGNLRARLQLLRDRRPQAAPGVLRDAEGVAGLPVLYASRFQLVAYTRLSWCTRHLIPYVESLDSLR
jgi:hypothetical protein